MKIRFYYIQGGIYTWDFKNEKCAKEYIDTMIGRKQLVAYEIFNDKGDIVEINVINEEKWKKMIKGDINE